MQTHFHYAEIMGYQQAAVGWTAPQDLPPRSPVPTTACDGLATTRTIAWAVYHDCAYGSWPQAATACLYAASGSPENVTPPPKADHGPGLPIRLAIYGMYLLAL